mgnify:CR=1 FL=1
MRTVSTEYKEVMDRKIRNRAYVSVGLGVVNQDAQKDGKVTSKKAEGCDTLQMFESEEHNVEYATMEENYFRAEPLLLKHGAIKKVRIGDAASILMNCRETYQILKPILEETHGCMLYQEQVMQIVRDLAGYSYGRSDLVRRAMAKKKKDVMTRERALFVHGSEKEGIPGAVSKGVPAQVAEQIFDEMSSFASYAFNKPHAACYAVVALRTGYLKCHYPAEFMAALMNSVSGAYAVDEGKILIGCSDYSAYYYAFKYPSK